MDKQEASGFSAYEDGHIVCHCARCQMEQTALCSRFSAVLPSTMTALRFHGDCGARITLDVEDGVRDENVEQVKKLIDWRNKVLEVTIRPVPK